METPPPIPGIPWPPPQIGGAQRHQDLAVMHPSLPEPPSDADRLLHALIGRVTGGIAPTGMALAGIDWLLHLSQAPAKWQRLAEKAWHKDLRWLDYAIRSTLGMKVPACINPLPQDRRFRGEVWQQWPYNLLQQAFLLNQQWWYNATTGVDGVTRHHEQLVSFTARQLLDMVSPLNFVATNPEVLAATLAENGLNFLRGAGHLVDDIHRALSAKPPAGAEHYRPGHAGRGGVPQRAHRTHPVQAGHAHRVCGTRADRAGVDHEVLHPRPVAAQLAGALPCGARAHGIHHLVAQPHRGRPRTQPE
jgi:polyhydroxyalkanoate synthase